jgi:hypothetical protein
MVARSLFGAIFGFVGPLSITANYYIRIIRFLHKKRGKVGEIQSQSVKRNEANRRSTRMLILVVANFAFFWAPTHCYEVIYSIRALLLRKDMCENTRDFMYIGFFGLVCHIFNPLIYWWMNEEFRSEVTKIFHLKKLRSIYY